MAALLPSLKARATQLLAQREQSGVELRQKLTRHAAAAIKADRQRRRGPAPAVPLASPALGEGDDVTIARNVDEALAWLRDNRLYSDDRFVESRVNARWHRFGNLRIREELSRHGVAPGGELEQRLAESEMERAQQVWSRRFHAAPEDAAAQARQCRFLAGRGFSPDVIRRVIRRAIRDAALPTTAE